MRAVTYDRFGDDSVLQLTQQPKPPVGPGEVLVKVKAAGVNPVDWKVMSGGLSQLMETQFPVVPGWDVAGIVSAVGIDTPEYAVGDEVIGYARKDWVHSGTFAEYATVAVRALGPKPRTLSWAQAAGLPLTGLTAYQVLKRLGLSSGQSVLIHGGAGGVGAAGIQLAVAAGATVLATASAKNHDYLRSLGATPIEYGPGLVDRVRSIRPGGVNLVADFVGGVVAETLAVLAPGGQHASIADPGALAAGGEWMWVRPDAADLRTLAELVDAGKLTVRVAAEFGLDQVAEAFALSREGHTAGKIILTIA